MVRQDLRVDGEPLQHLAVAVPDLDLGAPMLFSMQPSLFAQTLASDGYRRVSSTEPVFGAQCRQFADVNAHREDSQRSHASFASRSSL